MDFDEFDLLEFPHASLTKTSTEIIPDDFAAEIETPQENATKIAESNEPQSEIADDSVRTENLSPELIEAIAEKVAERFSNKVVKKIVREVMAQMEKK